MFKFLHANRIGEDCALLYMAWAWVAEVRGNFAFAEKVFARGIARKAEPLPRLQPDPSATRSLIAFTVCSAAAKTCAGQQRQQC